MKRLSIPLRLASMSLAVALLAACAPATVQGPSPAEVEGQVATAVAQTIEAQGQIATSVAMTVAAKDAETAAAQPAATSSPTLVPTSTPVLVTATPFPTSTSSASSGGSSSGGGTTSYAFSCDIIRQRPIDNTEYKRNNTFDVSFAILNNGTSTWEAGKDLVLLADHGILTTPFSTLELPKMEPGDVFSVGPYDAKAPDSLGHYVIDFKLEGGFCYPYVAFNIVR